ncbi:DNA replication/repair protein RecF [Desulfitobacterium hafniense]|uniref:DNA replication and repair protein RecF n=4 Tax=Desulfitobacterium hafniense TaxID=49338 RepID=RECF_DESHY|nr:DNA replication/repair protein RecF [Desulfitobacterium hafniense]B8FXW8.1 RecName: Full=DNA replication and repair protein RecF [Desulfitobacterium hafniense DCB-2]Q252K0.1 RecName: Full=DNA replication and repair protein RecF [Desulfitobacterium hafniense Y51]ACL18073.1 DNA replication and repair protein RecF [Desulfitobacterium hafniense DCB-2]EHL05308.1 putative DNA replication and repair protein RecF [Desulfitobacterium hafniense DP7]KTE93420.1 DNA replication protein RecF [Desulfitoba
MEIKWLHLKSFRNYQDQEVDFRPGLTILQGENGQGKTNILEGIYYLLTGKSYRVHREQELARWGENEFHLYGDFIVQRRKLRLESHYQDKRKIIKINQIPCRKLSEYVGTINVVFFSPDDLVMVKGGPAERRRFLDLHIAQHHSKHIQLLNAYNKVLQQKNALLKQGQGGSKSQIAQIELWNEQILRIGSEIIRNRWEFTGLLSRKGQEIYGQISSGKEELTMDYHALGKNNLEEALAAFPKLLAEKMSLEMERKMVLIGPHRDDILFKLNERSARLYGSQGQQRSIVLSTKLAELEVIRQEKGDYPLLLLDDVLSELDRFRRDYLLDYTKSLQQTIMTMTSAETLTQRASLLLKVEKGQIGRIE